MSEERFCCEWCGDEYRHQDMQTLGVCKTCADVADEVSSDALLPLPDCARQALTGASPNE